MSKSDLEKLITNNLKSQIHPTTIYQEARARSNRFGGLSKRLLMLHVDHFQSTITEKGRSKIVEAFSSEITEVNEALLILVSVEKQDETSPENVSKKTADEITQLAQQLKVDTIILHPFAHLFGELSRPEMAIKTLKLTEVSIRQKGFKTIRTPFGWFNTIDIKAKGHPISRVARIISAN